MKLFLFRQLEQIKNFYRVPPAWRGSAGIGPMPMPPLRLERGPGER
jgi:hypothetical protein